MCGFIFIKSNSPVERRLAQRALELISWRGPDSSKSYFYENDTIYMGHARLSVLDTSTFANQPMISRSGRYTIVYNGEIYNHLELRSSLALECHTTCDTETLLEGYEKIGERIFEMLDGMFAFVIFDNQSKSWIAARDNFGIKPLYILQRFGLVIIASETSAIREMVPCTFSDDSLAEWRVIRRPLPGKSYFNEIDEVLPSTYIDSSGRSVQYWDLEPSASVFLQEELEEKLLQSVRRHELSDVPVASLLSGGLDSAVIAKLSSVSRVYSVGLFGNNEHEGAAETASAIGRTLVSVLCSETKVSELWHELVRLRKEPLSVPNEALIYQVCQVVASDEKVVLTGEGADELFFGYDRIVRTALACGWGSVAEFLVMYGYSGSNDISERLLDYCQKLSNNRTHIEFLEDFLFKVHLPGLLRRMDFSSMAAGKEARVPFVCKDLVSYMYRRPAFLRINPTLSKLPLRELADKLKLCGALRRRKVGFSAATQEESRLKEYRKFRNKVWEDLQC